MFLFARFRPANLGGMANPAFNPQFVHQFQKPMHRSGSFDAHQHRARKLGIKLPHCVAFVHQSQVHHFSRGRVQHRQRLLASVQITSYNSHSASFGPERC
jgi:hypothetical protein